MTRQTSICILPFHFEQVHHHHVLIMQREVVGVGAFLDTFDLLHVLQKDGAKAVQIEINDPRYKAGFLSSRTALVFSD